MSIIYKLEFHFRKEKNFLWFPIFLYITKQRLNIRLMKRGLVMTSLSLVHTQMNGF